MDSGRAALGCTGSAYTLRCNLCQNGKALSRGDTIRAFAQGWTTDSWSREEPSFYLLLPRLARVQRAVSLLWELQLMGNGPLPSLRRCTWPGHHIYYVFWSSLSHLTCSTCFAQQHHWNQTKMGTKRCYEGGNTFYLQCKWAQGVLARRALTPPQSGLSAAAYRRKTPGRIQSNITENLFAAFCSPRCTSSVAKRIFLNNLL